MSRSKFNMSDASHVEIEHYTDASGKLRRRVVCVLGTGGTVVADEMGPFRYNGSSYLVQEKVSGRLLDALDFMLAHVKVGTP